VPANASAIPTDPSRTYFHEASTDALVTSSAISMADVIVVASIATHIKPTLLVVTAKSIVKANRFTKIWNRRARRGSSSRASPGPSHTESAVTTATQPASSADRASARMRSCPPATTAFSARTRRASAAAAPSETSDRPALAQPTARR
jgi:hypothetical protein